MNKNVHVYALSKEGERIFADKIVEENGVRTMNGVEVYFEEKQRTPLVIRDKKKYLSIN